MSKSIDDVMNLDYIILPVNLSPPTPPPDHLCLYASSDRRLYIKDSDGVTTQITVQ